MTVKTKPDTSLKLHEPVVLLGTCGDFAAGSTGTVVDVYRDGESYAVELFENGETLDVIDCERALLMSRKARGQQRRRPWSLRRR
jgi:hypothetical protein